MGLWGKAEGMYKVGLQTALVPSGMRHLELALSSVNEKLICAFMAGNEAR